MQKKLGEWQQALGLNKKNYDAKFVYSQQQVSNQEAILLPLYHQLPSQLDGLSPTHIEAIHALGCQMLREGAKALNVPISTLIVAQSIFHFFYARISLLQYDFRDVIMGSMYLACKSEETLRRTYQIALVFDFVFKVYQGKNNPKPLVVESQEYEHIKNVTILKAQLDILFELGFDIYRLLDIPHRYLGLFLTLFEKHPQYPKICQSSWKKLNDCYMTTACLYYPHQIIAAAAVYMGMRECEAKFPEIAWWTLLEAYEQAILNIEVMVEGLYLNWKNVNFAKLSDRIKEVGESMGYINPFPVPYHCKILLEKQGKFRVTKDLVDQAFNYNKMKEIKIENNEQKNCSSDNTNGRKILKVKKIEQTQQKAVIQHESETKKQNTDQPEKPNIDKKGLLANIADRLSKHSLANIKLTKKDSADQMDEEQDIIAELKRKKEQNKKNKPKQEPQMK